MDELRTTSRQIAFHSSGALGDALIKYCVAIINTKDSDDVKKWELFSGTLIEIGNRILVATASHCLERDMSPDRYWILGETPRHVSEPRPRACLAGYQQGDRPDVGFLEFERNGLNEYCNRIPLPLLRVKPAGTGRSEQLASLIGAPRELLESHVDGRAKKSMINVF